MVLSCSGNPAHHAQSGAAPSDSAAGVEYRVACSAVLHCALPYRPLVDDAHVCASEIFVYLHLQGQHGQIASRSLNASTGHPRGDSHAPAPVERAHNGGRLADACFVYIFTRSSASSHSSSSQRIMVIFGRPDPACMRCPQDACMVWERSVCRQLVPR